MHKIRESLSNKIIHGFAVVILLLQSSLSTIVSMQSFGRVAMVGVGFAYSRSVFASETQNQTDAVEEAKSVFDDVLKRNMTVPTVNQANKEISGNYQKFNKETGEWESTNITGGDQYDGEAPVSAGALKTRSLFSGDVADGQYYDNSPSDWSGTYGDQEALIDKSVEVNDNYESYDEGTGGAYDGSDANNSFDAQAWRSIKDYQGGAYDSGDVLNEHLSPQGMLEDPENAGIWFATDTAQDNIATFIAMGEENTGESLGSCNVTTETFSETETVTTVERKSCDKILDIANGVNECTIERIITQQYGVKSESWGDGNISSCGSNCMQIELGSPVNDSIDAGAGMCATVNFYADVMVKNAGAISSVTIQGAHEDHAAVRVGGTTVYDSGGTCNDPVDKTFGPIDITSQTIAAVSGSDVSFAFDIKAGDFSDGSVTIRIETNDPIEPMRIDLLEDPVGCYTGLFRDGDYPNGDTGYCYADSWDILEEQDVMNGMTGVWNDIPAFIPNEVSSRTVTKARSVNYTCDPYQGETVCEDDENGVERCMTWSEMVNDVGENECGSYEGRSECSLVYTGCAPEMTDPVTGMCFVEEYSVQCNEEHTIVNEYTVETNSCNSNIMCLDGSCDYGTDDSNGDFEQAVAAMGIMEAIEQDNTCNGVDGDEPGADASNCGIFEGQYLTCKKGWGGMVDCCDLGLPASSVGQMIEFGAATAQLGELSGFNDKLLANVEAGYTTADQAFGSFFGSDDSASEVINGAWESMSDEIGTAIDDAVSWVQDVGTEAYSALGEPIQNAMGNLFGSGAGDTALSSAADSVTSTVDGMSEMYDQMMQEVIDEISQYVWELLPDALKDAMLNVASSTGGATATSQVGAGQTGATVGTEAGGQILQEAVSNVVGPIMWAYTIYNMVNLALQLIYECEEEEYTLNQFKAQDSCIYSHRSCAKRVLGVCVLRKKHYCCYKSLQTRVIVEQILPQLGMSVRDLIGGVGDTINFDSGSGNADIAQDDICRGITPAELAGINWDAVDLSEWIAVLKKEDILNKKGSATAESITGSGHRLSNGDRKNVNERTTEVINEMGDKIPNNNIGLGQSIWEGGMPMLQYGGTDVPPPPDPAPTCDTNAILCSSLSQCLADYTGDLVEDREEICSLVFCPSDDHVGLCERWDY